MGAHDSAAMDDASLRAFVGRGGTGVLSLAAADVPYAAPVSYGFDPAERAFYLRLGFGPDSEKERFVAATAEARLVIYERSAEGWRSVVAVGPIEPVDDAALTAEVAATLNAADPPLFGIWDVPPEALEFRIYRLDAERLTGRQATGPAPD